MGLMNILLGIGSLLGAKTLERCADNLASQAKRERAQLQQVYRETGKQPISARAFLKNKSAHMEAAATRIERAAAALDELYHAINWQYMDRLYIDPALRSVDAIWRDMPSGQPVFVLEAPQAGLSTDGTQVGLVAETVYLSTARADTGNMIDVETNRIRLALQSIRGSYSIPDYEAFRQARILYWVQSGYEYPEALQRAKRERPSVTDPTNKKVQRNPEERAYFDQVMKRILRITQTMLVDSYNWYFMLHDRMPSGDYLHQCGYMTLPEYGAWLREDH